MQDPYQSVVAQSVCISEQWLNNLQTNPFPLIFICLSNQIRSQCSRLLSFPQNILFSICLPHGMPLINAKIVLLNLFNVTPGVPYDFINAFTATRRTACIYFLSSALLPCCDLAVASIFAFKAYPGWTFRIQQSDAETCP